MDKGQIGIRQNQYKPERVVANQTPSTVKRLNKQEVVEQLRARGSKYSLMGGMSKKVLFLLQNVSLVLRMGRKCIKNYVFSL